MLSLEFGKFSLDLIIKFFHVSSLRSSARNVLSNTNEQYNDDELDGNDQQRRDWHYPRIYPNKFFNWKVVQPADQDRILVETRRAKAIIKGDPREFMG